MKKFFTLIALLGFFLGAKAVEIVDAYVDYSTVTEIPRFGWGGSESAFARLSLQNGCLHFHSEEATDPSWDCQFFPIGGVNAEVGTVYTLHFKIKGSVAQNVSMLGFGQTPYGQFPITTDWVEGTIDYECTSAEGNLLMQCGDYVGDWDIAYLKITHEGRVEKPVEWIELIQNGDAENPWANPETAWNDQENNYKISVWTKEKGKHLNENGGSDPHPAEIEAEANGNHAFVCHATLADTEGDAAAWDNQIWLQSPRAWKSGEQFQLKFRYKASQPVVTNTQFHKQNPSDYLHWQAIGDVSFTTEWQQFEQVVTVPSDANGAWSIAFNLNPNVKDPVDFYIDDLSWSEMKLENGYFLAATNTVSGLVDYDYDNAIEFVYDAEMDALAATVGKVGDKDSWVNELMVSTVRGNDRMFKANTLKPKGAAKNDPEFFMDYEEAASAKIKLSAAGVWTVYIDTETKQMAFQMLEGDAEKEPITIVANPTEVVVNAVERDWKPAKDDGTPQEGEEGVGAGQEWDNQFFIIGNRVLQTGEEVTIEFDYKAETAAMVNTQNSQGAGGYLHWAGIGSINFTDEYQHFEKTLAIPADAKDQQNSWTFNLAVMKGANKYYFKNIIFKLADDTETLIDAEGTANLFVKEGAGTTAYQYGTDPDGIESVVTNNTVVTAKFNLAGQRVSNNFKGIVVTDGKKYIVK